MISDAKKCFCDKATNHCFFSYPEVFIFLGATFFSCSKKKNLVAKKKKNFFSLFFDEKKTFVTLSRFFLAWEIISG